jgi:hypothetical protein
MADRKVPFTLPELQIHAIWLVANHVPRAPTTSSLFTPPVILLVLPSLLHKSIQLPECVARDALNHAVHLNPLSPVSGAIYTNSCHT